MWKPYSYTVTIEKEHMDGFGHVNNAAYLKLFEKARWDIINKNDYGWNVIREVGLGPILLEIWIKLRKEILLGEVIKIETQVMNYDRIIGKLGQKIINAQGELCSQAQFNLALFDIKRRKVVSPTVRWKSALGWQE